MCRLITFFINLLVSMRGVIGQFCRPCFTVRPTKLQLVSFPVCPLNLRTLVSFILSQYCKLWILFFLLIYGPCVNRKNSVSKLTVQTSNSVSKRYLCIGSHWPTHFLDSKAKFGRLKTPSKGYVFKCLKTVEPAS